MNKMSQDLIMELMKQQPNKWFNIEEVSKKLKISRQATTHSFKMLRTNKFVHFNIKQTYGKKPMYIHRYK